jgi:hypothetical protein
MKLIKVYVKLSAWLYKVEIALICGRHLHQQTFADAGKS